MIIGFAALSLNDLLKKLSLGWRGLAGVCLVVAHFLLLLPACDLWFILEALMPQFTPEQGTVDDGCVSLDPGIGIATVRESASWASKMFARCNLALRSQPRRGRLTLTEQTEKLPRSLHNETQVTNWLHALDPKFGSQRVKWDESWSWCVFCILGS